MFFSSSTPLLLICGLLGLADVGADCLDCYRCDDRALAIFHLGFFLRSRAPVIAGLGRADSQGGGRHSEVNVLGCLKRSQRKKVNRTVSFSSGESHQSGKCFEDAQHILVLRATISNHPRLIVAMPRKMLIAKSLAKSLRIDAHSFRHLNCRYESGGHELDLSQAILFILVLSL